MRNNMININRILFQHNISYLVRQQKIINILVFMNVKLFWMLQYHSVMHIRSKIGSLLIFLLRINTAFCAFIFPFSYFVLSLFSISGPFFFPLLFIVTFVEEFIEYLIGKCRVNFHTKKKEREKDFCNKNNRAKYLLLCTNKRVIIESI